MSHPDELIGQQVDHYLVQAHLAGGGMAEVYLAQDTWLERPSALKVLKGMYAAEAEHRARFRREAQAIARLAHPYIVEIYNIGTLADGRPYFTMPYLSGGSLADWLLRENGRPLSPAHALTLCRHIADALGTAHQAGMVHRDLKPANILLRGPLEPVVTDFGIAALSAQSVQLTRPGVFMGTYLYASPEQKLGLPVDHRSDIYSLGVILFELLAGVLPGGQQRPFDQLQQINPQLSPFLYDLVDRCLQQQPADRYPAAASLMLDLDLALSGVTETRPSPAPTQTRPRSPDWFWILLPVAAVLFVIGGYLFYAGTISTPLPSPMPTNAAAQIAPAPVDVDLPQNQIVVKVVTSTLLPPVTIELPPTETATPTPEPTETAVPTNTPLPTRTLLPPPVPQQMPPTGRIVFTCFIEEMDQLCTINADGTGYTQVTDAPATDFYASFAPDGQRIHFSSRREGAFLLYEMSADGTDVHRIGPSDQGSLFGPAASPDGQRLAFASILGTNHAIWVMNRDGSGLTRIIESDRYYFVDPTWSPDGRKIAFSSNMSGQAAFFIMNADGFDVQRLSVSVSALGGRNDWSPDGKWLTFYAGPRNGSHIYLASIDGNGVYRLTDRSSNLAPSFSPDGNWIAFTSYRDGDGEIFIMRIDGSDVRQLTFNDYTDWQPRWSK